LFKKNVIGSSPGLSRFRQVTQEVHHQLTHHFKPGQIFRGKVLEGLPQGRVLISAKGIKFLASTEVPLKVGIDHYFQVKSCSPKVLVKVLRENPQGSSLPVRIWVSPSPNTGKMGRIVSNLVSAYRWEELSTGSRRALQNLSALIPKVVYTGSGKENGQWLAECLIASGLFWENKAARHLLGQRKGKPPNYVVVQDLKGVLLLLLQRLEKESREKSRLEGLVGQVKEALHIIEEEQSLNIETMRGICQWYHCIPGLEEKGLKKVEVFLEKSHGNGAHHVSLELDFTMLGKMNVEVYLLGSNIRIQIFVDDANKASLVSGELESLGARLESIGLGVGALKCEVRDSDVSDPELPFGQGSCPIHVVI
jgi:hypothetical protein